jgi:phosphate acyltransferase
MNSMERSERITIALDAMGGDFGASVVVPAALDFLKKDDEVDLILVGKEDMIKQHLNGYNSNRLSIKHASEEVAMDEPPSKVLRNKKDSSMRVAINLVHEGVADACVSSGNTGALMATARFVLKTLPNIDRPAIISSLPSIDGRTWMLDLGANIDCSAEHLFQFAVMGSELVRSVDGIESPKVGLLNVGEEEIKGNEQVKGAHELLSNSSLNYVGYTEGDHIYTSDVDLIVCDGFVGNISLKSSEGLARMFRHFLISSFKKGILTRIAGLIAMPVLNYFKKTLDPRNYNGATLLGLNGIVIKSHGGADIYSFENAIRMAKKEVTEHVPEHIAEGIESQFENRGAA